MRRTGLKALEDIEELFQFEKKIVVPALSTGSKKADADTLGSTLRSVIRAARKIAKPRANA